MIPALVVALLLWFVAPAQATSCTKGVNCYCDRVQGGDLNDTLLLICEDFEAPTLYQDTGVGNGAPYYGPWYDETGFGGGPCARGYNSYWQRNYANGVGAGAWFNGFPASPTRGCTCTYGQCFRGSWDATDRWQANTNATTGGGGAISGIFQDADFSAEIGTITKPTGRAGGGSGAFDGIASLAHRIPAGNNAGILGGKDLGVTPQRTFGITMAVAYASNVGTSGIWGGAWKHNEWRDARNGGGGGDGLFLFHNTSSRGPQTPFYSMFAFVMDDTPTDCTNKKNAATLVAGNIRCNGGQFYWEASAGTFVQATDWPDGTWGCVRGYFQDMGTTNSKVKITFTGPSGVEQVIVEFTGMDLTGTAARDGYDKFLWNNYANTNQGLGETPSVVTTFRYEDNVHIRAGAPVSCAQIGFAASSSGPTTTVPGGYTIPGGWVIR